jgi:hypothetical protein
MVSFENAFNLLKETYKYFTIKILCYEISSKDSKQLQNITTQIYFHDGSYEEQEKHELKNGLHIIIHTYKIKINNFDNWTIKKKELNNKHLKFNEFIINYNNSLDDNKEILLWRVESGWPYCKYYEDEIEVQNNPFNSDGTYISLGYDSKLDAMTHLIDGNSYIDSNNKSITSIILPIYCKIDDVVIYKNNSIMIKIKKHIKIKDLVLSARIDGIPEENIYGAIKEKQVIERIIIKNKRRIILKKIKCIEPLKHLTIKLNHELLEKEIYFKRELIQDLLIKNNIFLSPLLEAVSLFLPYQEFKKMIEFRSNSKDYSKKIKEEDIFEDCIQKILCFGGISAISLGEYEKLKKEDSKVTIGSADILAYDEDSATLLIISCKSESISKEYINHIYNTAKIIKERISDKRINVEPVIFIYQEQPNRNAFDLSNIHLLDKEKMNHLLSIIQTRKLLISDIIEPKIHTKLRLNPFDTNY